MTTAGNETTTLGVVSFLNARPLIEGLDARAGVSLYYAVPSALPSMLRHGDVDAALVPVIDLARGANLWQRISDAGIACDGETLTVRVFSQTPPEHVNVLYVDDDSHTSVVLAQLFWSHWYERRLTILPLSAAEDLNACPAVLLIGDKVVTAPLEGFAYELDLGGAWRQWQGVPFVFAAWAAPMGRDHAALAALLSAARDRGVARAAELAAEYAPAVGWPVEVAVEYLTRRLQYTLTPDAEEGMQRFFDLAAAEGIVPQTGALAR